MRLVPSDGAGGLPLRLLPEGDRRDGPPPPQHRRRRRRHEVRAEVQRQLPPDLPDPRSGSDTWRASCAATRRRRSSSRRCRAPARYHDFQKRAATEETFGSDYEKRFDLALEYTEHFAYFPGRDALQEADGRAKAPADIRDRAYYQLAVTQALQNRFGDATTTLNAFSKVETKGEAYERSRLLQAQMYWQQGNVMAAANELRQFKTRFPGSPLKDNADQMLQIVQQQLQKK